MITSTFDRKGVFETISLSLNNWSKISNQQLRKFLKVSKDHANVGNAAEEDLDYINLDGSNPTPPGEDLNESDLLMR